MARGPTKKARSTRTAKAKEVIEETGLGSEDEEELEIVEEAPTEELQVAVIPTIRKIAPKGSTIGISKIGTLRDYLKLCLHSTYRLPEDAEKYSVQSQPDEEGINRWTILNINKDVRGNSCSMHSYASE